MGSFGMWAFQANNLKEITLPPSLTYIGDGAFSRNFIKNANVPYSVENFNSNGFDHYVKIAWY